MKIRGMILGQGRNKIVRDGRTLQAMAKAGHFTLPDEGHPYVNNGDKPCTFYWHWTRYRIEYFDGCIFPFVVLANEPLWAMVDKCKTMGDAATAARTIADKHYEQMFCAVVIKLAFGLGRKRIYDLMVSLNHWQDLSAILKQ